MAASERATIPFEVFEGKLRAHDDPDFWRLALVIFADEFVQRHEEESPKGDWAVVVGASSHWNRPHQTRWTAAGGFAYPEGYKQYFPKFDWSITLVYRGGQLVPVAKLSGKKVNLFQIAIPSRTMRHKQTAVHTRWSTAGKSVLFGFRKLNGKWKCVAASDEKLRGPVLAPSLY